jgi:hypothetical protein
MAAESQEEPPLVELFVTPEAKPVKPIAGELK